LHDRWKKSLTRRRQKDEQYAREQDEAGAPSDDAARTSMRRIGPALFILRQRKREHEQREADMPEDIEPYGRLRASAEQSLR
jgi:hypothetical protein